MDELYERLKELKALFDEAHNEGMASLRRGNYEGYAEAVRIERDLIEEQAAILASRRAG